MGKKINNLCINLLSNFSQGGGYPGASESIAITLERKGVDIRVLRLTPYSPRNVRPEGNNILEKPFIMSDIGVAFSYPIAFNGLMNHKIRIGYTMFETDKLPDITDRNPDWVKACNSLTRLWVPSKHCADLFRNSGVKVPIDIIQLGVDPNLYSFYERPERNTFTFLMLGTLTIRKNPGIVLSAFLALFKNNPNVRIVFKTQSGTMGHIQMPDKNVIIIDKLASVQETIQYYRDADCYVCTSRGEGFCLPPVEAMATGLPVIVAKNTGMLEYCNEEYNYPIECPNKVPVMRMPKEWGNCGNWWDVDYEQLKKTMMYVYEHQKEAKEKGVKAAEWVKNNWTYDKTANKIINILNNIDKKIDIFKGRPDLGYRSKLKDHLKYHK
jgi:glycosyltransferase involved in cell wall biosynthesis